MIYQNIFKPFFDYSVALSALALTAPILLVTMVLIKIDSRGPVFFLQERVGKNGKIFNLYKFRSMSHKKRDYEKQVFVGNADVTFVGKIIRRTKIDELPQLFNVIIGDMSLVGPRPSLPSLIERFNEDGKFRLFVKPGCTNLAAVNGSIFLTWPERWVYDRYYVENLSFLLDLKIIFKTVVVIFIGEKIFLRRINDISKSN